MKNSKLFPWLVALSALAVSGSAAYYSVYGMSRMFAGAANNVIIMAGSLEFSKLVIASLLYSYWKNLNKILRTYLTIACGVLILITSAGIYGFLSSAYQETANKVETIAQQSGSLEKQKIIILSEIKRYESQISMKESRLTSLSDIRSKQQGTMDVLISKNQSIKSVKSQMTSIESEITQIEKDINVLNDSLNIRNEKIKNIDLQTLGLQTNQDVAKEIGPLKYIAKITGKTLDQIVNYFIIALMLVFDPLAIALVIASNFLFSSLNSEKTAVTQGPKEKDSEEIKEQSENEDMDIFDGIEETEIPEIVKETVIEDTPPPPPLPIAENSGRSRIHKPVNPGIREMQIDPTRLA